jgi:hypothetical protein
MTPSQFYSLYPHLNIPQPNTPPQWVVVEFSNVQVVSGYQNTITYVIKYANGTAQSGYAPSVANGWVDSTGRDLYYTFNVLTNSFITPNPRAY